MLKKISILLMAFLLLFPTAGMAKIQTITATGTYIMGEKDTMASAKEEARKDAIRMAGEKAGVYVKSYSRTNNLELTKDEVETFAVRVLKVNSCTYTQEYKDNSLIFHANIEASFDDADFDELITGQKKISSLQNELKAEKEKNEDIKNDAIRRTGADTDTAMILIRGENEIRKGSNFNAVTVLNSLIKERRGIVPARAYYLRSVANYNLGHSSNASDDINMAIKTDPRNPLYYVHKGFLELDNHDDYYEAEALGDTAQSFNKRYWPAMYLRAVSKAFRGSTRKAREDCEDAMKRGAHGVSFAEYFKSQLEMQFKGRHSYVYISSDDKEQIINDSINGLMTLPEKKKKK